jgi:sigma-B regulation protein RsbU (phosphoserine phosphatase)
MMFVTLVFGIFDPETGRVDFVNAGHLPPIRVAAGAAEFIEAPGDIAVAVAEAMEYSTQSVELAPGEALVLYTDGVTEAFNASEEQFGEARLLTSLEGIGGKDSAALADGILATVKAFEVGVDQSDDITLLVVQRSVTET